jgi:hypothetical protein
VLDLQEQIGSTLTPTLMFQGYKRFYS